MAKVDRSAGTSPVRGIPMPRKAWTPEEARRYGQKGGKSPRKARHKRAHPEVWYAGYQAGFAAYSRYLAKVRKAGRVE